MKQAEILKVLSEDLGTGDVAEINKMLKAKDYVEVRYRIAGKILGHSGFNGLIKAVTEEGVKVFGLNKVSLIRFVDMEVFVKAKPREERKVYASTEAKPQKPVVAKPKAEMKQAPVKSSSGAGSRFIPKK